MNFCGATVPILPITKIIRDCRISAHASLASRLADGTRRVPATPYLPHGATFDMPLRPLFVALVLAALVAGRLRPAQAASGPVSLSASQPKVERIHFAVMGEVARPGVYETRGSCTLAQLIKRAGGITEDASESLRVYRSGRLAEQVFLASGGASPLFAGDLVVVERRAAFSARGRSAISSRGSNAAASEVQIAFLGLIDRPVIIKMLGDQASVARIIEILRQPRDLAASIRVIAPSGSRSCSPGSIDFATRPLDSGTILVFPGKSIRAEALPAFPEPIAETARDSSAAVGLLTRPADSPHAPERAIPPGVVPKPAGGDPSIAMKAPAIASASRVAPSTGSPRPTEAVKLSDHPQRAALHAWPASRRRAQAVLHPMWIQDDEQEKASRNPHVFALISAIAVAALLVMLVTLVSIARRNKLLEALAEGSRRIRIAWRARRLQSDGSVAVPPAPVPSAVGRVGRPIRIDARRPTTKLSLHLAAIEATTSSSR
jgi:hypothetical protein